MPMLPAGTRACMTTLGKMIGWGLKANPAVLACSSSYKWIHNHDIPWLHIPNLWRLSMSFFPFTIYTSKYQQCPTISPFIPIHHVWWKLMSNINYMSPPERRCHDVWCLLWSLNALNASPPMFWATHFFCGIWPVRWRKLRSKSRESSTLLVNYLFAADHKPTYGPTKRGKTTL